LEQTGVKLPEGVDGNDEGDPWRHLLDRKAGAQSFPLPAPPPIVSRVDPGLVDVDYPLLILEESEELEGTLLPLDQAPLRVSMDRNWDNLLVVKAKKLVHHPLDLELNSCLLFVISLDVLCPLDEFAIQQLGVYELGQSLIG